VNLFDRARENIPPAEKHREMHQCVVCATIKDRDQFDTKADGSRDTWCKPCLAYERTPPHEQE